MIDTIERLNALESGMVVGRPAALRAGRLTD